VKNGQVRESRNSIVQCPECSSYNAAVLDISVPNVRCRCTDCGNVYSVRVREVTNDDDDNGSTDEDDEAEDFTLRRRKAKADSRAQIAPTASPDPAQLGLTTVLVDKTLADGPAGLRKAQRVALKFARQFQQETEDQFKKRTNFLNQWFDSIDPNARMRARYALVWRPKFLAGLSLTNSPTLAARFARTTKQTAYNHRKWDSEFAQQWEDAVENAVDLLHARAFQRALEGDCEPVFYMGLIIGYVRKYDSKLQIEMLRAYKPDTFKTAGVQVNIAAKGDLFVLTEEQRLELQRVNRDWLLNSPIEADVLPENSQSRLGPEQDQPLTKDGPSDSQ
jgi:hypothetical protein